MLFFPPSLTKRDYESKNSSIQKEYKKFQTKFVLLTFTAVKKQQVTSQIIRKLKSYHVKKVCKMFTIRNIV